MSSKQTTPYGLLDKLAQEIICLTKKGFSLREISFLINKSFSEVEYLYSQYK